MKMYLGMAGEQMCQISGNAPNQHVLITGQSGSGKTCRMLEMELWAARNGAVVVVLDLSDTHAQEQIYPKIAEEYEAQVNRIAVKKQGLDPRFLFPKLNDAADKVQWKGSVVQILTSAVDCSMKLKITLRKAIMESSRTDAGFLTELKELLWLKQTEGGDEIYERLWPLFAYDILKNTGGAIHSGEINILSFHGLEMDSQVLMASVFVAALWEQAQQGLLDGEIVIFLDEFQNLPHGKASVLRRILREGRKFGVNLVLATQTMDEFSDEAVAIFQQAATRLYFHPTLRERRKISSEIDPDNYRLWMKKLDRLSVGHCVALGEKMVSGRNISRPLIL